MTAQKKENLDLVMNWWRSFMMWERTATDPDAMKHLALVFTIAISLVTLCIDRARAAACEPAGTVRFVCDQSGPEDLVQVPGGRWVISSGMGADGAVRLVSIRDRTSTVLFPSSRAKERPDEKTYNSCPGPIDPAEKDAFKAHGLYLRPGHNSVHTLFVVHHGNRESIEVFELDARPAAPTLTWVGCAVAPDPIGLNSVVGLPDGGFVTTNFIARGVDAAVRTRMMNGEPNGELWEWHTSTGWQRVAGTEFAGPNGIEVSKDGRWLYIAAWGSQSLVRMSRGQTPMKKDAVPLGFRVDNLRWASDNTLLAAGQGGMAPSQTSHVARVDPTSLKVQELLREPYDDVLTAGTVAIQIGKDLWVGSVRGDRIAIFPLAPPQTR